MTEPPKFEPAAASSSVVSLSQVLLAPLDALFKAQVHAARSFVNFLLQIGYGDKPERRRAEASQPAPGGTAAQPDTIYTMNFVQEVPGPANPDGSAGPPVLQKVSIPTLALVPLRPLSIESAEVQLAMEVTWVGRHQQMRPAARAGEAPGWFLVDEPISLRGHVASGAPGDESSPSASDKRLIQIKVNVSTVPTPSGLEKLLTLLTQSSKVENHDKPT